MLPSIAKDNPGTCAAVETGWFERRFVAESVVCFLAFLAFVRTVRYQFVYDDHQLVLDNYFISSWREVPRYFSHNTLAELGFSHDFYRPMWLLWFRLNHALFGLRPWGWHLALVLCHVLATCLVFVVIERIGRNRHLAFAAATIFAVHPVHVESVAWVCGVTDVLMTVFLLASFLAYLMARDSVAKAGWITLSIVFFGFSLLTKEAAFVLPALLFAYEYAFAGQGTWAEAKQGLKRALPFVATAAAYLAWRSHVTAGLMHSSNAGPIAVVMTLPSVLWLYARHLLAPVGLSEFYGLPWVTSLRSRDFLVPTALLLALVAIACWRFSRLRERRLAAFAGLWIAICLAPSLLLSAFDTGDIAHDRFLYLPSIGFVILVSIVIQSFAERWQLQRVTVSAIATLLLSAILLLATSTQHIYWATDMSLYSRGVQIAPQDTKAAASLANELAFAGRFNEAIEIYTYVLRRNPRDIISLHNLGYAYYKVGRFAEAEKTLQSFVAMARDSAGGFFYLGLSQLELGKTDDAASSVGRAIELLPHQKGYHLAMAMIRIRQNDRAAGRAELLQEQKYHPESTDAVQQKLAEIENQ